MTKFIEDYALIGDCETAALVSRDGSIDWLCWPRFDSGAVFAALLGGPDNGSWSIVAADRNARTTRRYRDNTLILETDIETGTGAGTLIDFMPLRKNETSHLIRIVRVGEGQLDLITELALRFDYGSIVPWVKRVDDNCFKAIAGPDMAILRTNVPMRPEGYKHVGNFTVRAGETVAFVLSYGSSFHSLPETIDPLKTLEQTEQLWRKWSGQSTLSGDYSKEVLRSLLTLKALTYHRTGGIVAAPTTSLPETIGGTRNWDYRYCWLRDATFTLLALVNSGFHQEASAWRTWLRHAVAGKPEQVQIMYGLAGERRLDERELDWLEGYERSRPVRIGNAAGAQLQLDIFGEVMDALFLSGVSGIAARHSDWDLQCKLIEHLEAIWQDPDEGIWEIRSGAQQFTHSKVMAWVAMDRAVKSVECFGVEAPIEQWRTTRNQIHKQVCEEGYNTKLNSFVQTYGSNDLDASALLFPLVGFLPPSDPRIESTVAAIQAKLMVGGLVRRYDTACVNDGVRSGEGAFLACSFWLADNLILLGRRQEARELFEYLLSLRNDVGLLSEEYDPKARRMLGNFPQAFSHVSLINTARNLSTQEKPAEQRSGHTTEPTKQSEPCL